MAKKEEEACPDCNGQGWLCGICGVKIKKHRCPEHGRLSLKACSRCQGTGKIKQA